MAINGCNQQPGFGGGDVPFPVLGQPSASPQPGKSAFHHPAPGDRHKSFWLLWTSHDLDTEILQVSQRRFQFVSGITAIGVKLPQGRENIPGQGNHFHGSVAILDAGRMHHPEQQITQRIGDDVRLRPLTFFPAS